MLYQPDPHSRSGFALVIALSLMAFVLLLLLSMSTLVQVESRSAQIQMQRLEAEQAALLSLNVAIGKLQEVAGPDQRITASASIFGDSNNGHISENPDGSDTIAASVNTAAGQDAWVGVWKSDTVAVGTASYSPAIPDQRKFLGWLVSSVNDSTGQLELPQQMSAVGTDVSSSPNYVKLATDSNQNAYMQVEKVPVADSDTSFAFSIEDESLKADLSWSEHSKSATSAERYQAGRLSAAPGPDYGVLNGSSTGPFDTVSYPLSSDGTTLISNGILKLSDIAGITSGMSSGDEATAWLKDSRGHVTWGSRGVMADVKLGGLRRDLSLAFEMDGDDEAENASLFNQQDGEFVSLSVSQDKLTPPGKPIGMEQYERFLYRDTSSSGNPFSGDITNGSSVLRGPNWWALRDYANLYKRLKGTSGDYTMAARAYYPNLASEGGKSYQSRFAFNGSDQWDQENVGSDYIYRPARPAYAPVMLGTVAFVSLGVEGGNYAVVIDSLYYLWNPYNRKIKFESLALQTAALDGAYLLEVTDTTTGELKKYYSDMASLIGKNPAADGKNPFISLLQPDSGALEITMEPGEVMVVTSGVDHEATTGYFSDGSGGSTFATSGVFMTQLAPEGDASASVSVSTTGTTYEFSFYKSVSGVNNGITHSWRTALPIAGTTPDQIASSWNSVCNDIQFYSTQSAGFGSRHEELESEGVNIKTKDQEGVSQIDGPPQGAPSSKGPPVGMFLTLMKPTNFVGDSYTSDTTYPSEVFSRFNPAPMSAKRDFWRECMLNQQYAVVKDTGSNLLENYGISFSGSGRTGYWGTSFDGNGDGLSHVPMSNIPSVPLLSLAQFSHANLSFFSTDPFHAVGNSWSHPLIPADQIYSGVVYSSRNGVSDRFTADHSWLLNDALFDRYYLSGIAPEYTIGGSGYSSGSNVEGEIEKTLIKFFSSDYQSAQANPVLLPYLPQGLVASDAVDELKASDGFQKMGAYSMINGQFNVNSTSVEAWEALLQANRSLPIVDAQGGNHTGTGSPFPSSTSPADPNLSDTHWSGFSRLDTDQIRDLAERIVEQVKLRGPFMSLSHFINRSVGDPASVTVAETVFSGALQTAIENTSPNINRAVRDNAGGAVPDYHSVNRLRYYQGGVTADDRKTTTGIAGDITQADLLLSLAPRLSARSDTFRIRSYGEVRSIDGSKVLSHAICEAVVQRIPEYIDPVTNKDDNEPWGEAINPVTLVESSNFNALNKKFGRRFKIVQFRWLAANEL